MIIGVIAIVAVGIFGLVLWGACVSAGQYDDAVDAARRREAAKHAVDVDLWSAMAGAAMDNGRDGEIEP